MESMCESQGNGVHMRQMANVILFATENTVYWNDYHYIVALQHADLSWSHPEHYLNVSVLEMLPFLGAFI